jgi:mycothiol synthase
VTEEWTGWGIDPGRDGVAVCDADGALAGYAVVFAGATLRESFRVVLDGRVHPGRRGRGLGGALLDWQLARGAEVHAARHPEAPARLVVGVLGSQPALQRLVERRGLTAERWYRAMERPLTDLPRCRPVPGVDLLPFTEDRDDEVRRAHNAAFTRHHGSSERDAASWRALFTGRRAFWPELSVLAVEDGAVQGYVLAYVYESDARARGYREVVLGQIGVLPAARGRGIAAAAITAVVRRAAEDGCRTSALDVDSDNVTGALRLYEGLGFETVRTRMSWSQARLPVPAG